MSDICRRFRMHTISQVEIWRAIPTWEGLYEVSDHGRVRSLDRTVKGRQGPTHYRGRVLKPGYGSGYALVTLAETGRGRREQKYVHDLVLLVFVGPKPLSLEVCHGPAGQQENGLLNLRYDTRRANAQDRKLFGKPYWWRHSTKLSSQQIAVVQSLWPRNTTRAIGRIFGVSHSTVRRYLRK